MQRAYPKRTGKVEVFSVLRDKSFPLRKDLPHDGEVFIEMPNSLSETRLQYCTTQRLAGILEVVNTRKDLRRRLTGLWSPRHQEDSPPVNSPPTVMNPISNKIARWRVYWWWVFLVARWLVTVSLLSKLHRKLTTMFWCDANMTSLPIWLTSVNSFLMRPVFLNRAMANGQNQETKSK